MLNPAVGRIKMEKIEISIDEYKALKAKAEAWDNFCKKQAKHLNDKTPEERSEAARKAVQARWSKAKD